MRLVSFVENGRVRIGVRAGDGVVPVRDLRADAPDDMCALLAEGEAALRDLARRAESAPNASRKKLDVLALAPVVPRPGKVLCLGLNYRDHAAEAGLPLPQHPVVFLRAATSLLGADQPLQAPAQSEQLDYEGELAVVIGVGGRGISERDAHKHIAGYTIFNDVTVRDYQMRGPQWTIGKNFDATGVLGPELVTTDELAGGAEGLRIRTRVNGRVLQDGSTADMIFNVATTIASLSETMTLEPGDVIATGTPAGVGGARTPPVWLKAGDVCEVEIEGIGVLRTPIVVSAG